MVQLYITGAKENFHMGAKIISKALHSLELSSDDIKAERDRIRAEIRESDDRSSLSMFASGIVHEATSLSRPILGSLGSISRIRRKGLEEYRKRVFTRDNIFFYVTGSFEDSDILRFSEIIGGAELAEGQKHENFAPVPEKFGKREPRVYIKNADFTMVRFNFDMDMNKLSCPVTDLVYDMLLSGYNSRFFIEMSEKRGLFYDLSGSLERYRNIGSLSFSYEVRQDSLYDALEMTFSILSGLRSGIVDEEDCMKAGYVNNAYMLYDDSRELNFTFAYDNHIMNNAYLSLEERAECYRCVTPGELRAAASEIFKPRNLTLTIKGSKKKIDQLKIEQMIKDWA